MKKAKRPQNKASQKGIYTEGAARFTFLTSHCVRLEYAPAFGFVDEPTLFAFDRSVRDAKVEVTRKQGLLVLESATIRVEYRPDGKAFHDKNLQVIYTLGGKKIVWKPGSKNKQNLGGPVATLDAISKAFDLPDGLLSRDGWYLIDDSGKAIFKDGWIAQRPGGVSKADRVSTRESIVNPDFDGYLFLYGTDYKSALATLATISGRAAMPRKHVLGSWYCRWHAYTADDFRQIIREYKEHDFPIDVLVMDMDWHTQKEARTGFGHATGLGWTGYTWNKKLIPDPKKLLADLKKDSIYVTLNDHPADGLREHEAYYKPFMKQLGKNAMPNPPFNAGDKHYMDAFFKYAQEPLEKDGVDFWWVDWQQDYIYPTVMGVPGLRQLPWLNHLYFQHSLKNGRRGQGFSRWGGWGDHRHPIQFSGDATACWDMLEFEVPFTVASGNAGCFFWAHDAGGFYGERNPETFTRWVQFCTLSASLRLHSTGDKLDRRPWLWGKRFEDAMRQSYKLRAELIPYVYTSVRQCYDQTLPLLRGMYLDYPNEKNAYKFSGQYMFGEHLLAAPITSKGAGSNLIAKKEVWFPKGDWYNYFTGEKIKGGQIKTVSAKIDEIPLYVRGGTPIPLQPYTSRMTSALLETLRVKCYPGEFGESSLYEDDGQTDGYIRGQFARTPLAYEQGKGCARIQIGKAEGTFKGQLKERAYQIEFVETERASSAAVNGKKVRIEYDRKQRTNIVKISTKPISEELEVVIFF